MLTSRLMLRSVEARKSSAVDRRGAHSLSHGVAEAGEGKLEFGFKALRPDKDARTGSQSRTEALHAPLHILPMPRRHPEAEVTVQRPRFESCEHSHSVRAPIELSLRKKLLLRKPQACSAAGSTNQRVLKPANGVYYQQGEQLYYTFFSSCPAIPGRYRRGKAASLVTFSANLWYAWCVPPQPKKVLPAPSWPEQTTQRAQVPPPAGTTQYTPILPAIAPRLRPRMRTCAALQAATFATALSCVCPQHDAFPSTSPGQPVPTYAVSPACAEDKVFLARLAEHLAAVAALCVPINKRQMNATCVCTHRPKAYPSVGAR
eukprot:199928-Prorocentrum_minimum.AAC.2